MTSTIHSKERSKMSEQIKCLKISENKKQYLNLLLLGDEQEDMIDRYLERGEMFVLVDGEPFAAAVITDEGGGVCELKNIAVAPAYQGKGYGKKMIEFLCSRYKSGYHTMLAGTGDSTVTLPFYKCCGFAESYRVKNFFIDYYNHPIFESGVQLIDMVYLKRPLWVIKTERLGFRRLTHEDYDSLHHILGDAATMYAWEYGFSDEQIIEWINKNLMRYEKDGFAYHAAIDKASGELIGVMGALIENIDGTEQIGIGYIVAKKHWGKGYATEGARAWIQYAFEQLGAARVIADIRPENTAFRKAAERLGMVVTGEHVKHHSGKDMVHLIYTKNKRG